MKEGKVNGGAGGLSLEEQLYKRYTLDLGEAKKTEGNASKIGIDAAKKFAETVKKRFGTGFDFVLSDPGVIENTGIIDVKKGGKAYNLCLEVAGSGKKIKALFINFGSLAADLHVRLKENALLELSCFYYSKSDSDSVSTLETTLDLERGSQARVNLLHCEDERTALSESNKVHIEGGSMVRINRLQIGGSVVQAKTHIILDGERAEAKEAILIIGAGSQRFDILSEGENCAERTIFHNDTKAVLMEGSSGIIKDLARIRHGAKGSDSVVKERAVLINEGHASLLPDMSIEENDVKASHSAISAPIDKNALFYLMSRGIGETEARRLIIDSLAAEFIKNLEDEHVKGIASGLINEKIRANNLGAVIKAPKRSNKAGE